MATVGKPRIGRAHDGVAPIATITRALTPEETWQQLGLEVGSGHMPHATVSNAARIISGHEKFRGRLWFDLFRQRPYYKPEDGGAEREWRRADTVSLTIWMQHELKLSRFHSNLVEEAVDAAAMVYARDPLLEWLNSLEWDGTERLPTLLSDAFGAEQNEYTSAVGRCFLVSMIARAYKPGCQVDTMPVLEGAQGIRKSSALAVLGRPFYAALPTAFGGRDFLQALDGVWLAEIPDMSGFKGRDIEHVKAAITTPEDRYCRRYARVAETWPRRCVFAATSNSDRWNADNTGARRFLPIRCAAVGPINLEYLAAQRSQLFAEARERFKRGEQWWDYPIEAALAEQEERRISDTWEEVIEHFITHEPRRSEYEQTLWVQRPCELERTTVDEVLEQAIGIPIAKQGRAEQNRAGEALKLIGWRRRRNKDRRGWHYDNPKTLPPR